MSNEHRMSPVYETLTVPSWLPGHETQLLLPQQHRGPLLSPRPPSSSLKTGLNEQSWVGQLLGGGWGSRLAVVKCRGDSSRDSAGALQLLQRGGFFWLK